MVTPKGSMSTEGVTFQVSVLPYLQVLDMSTLGDAADVNPVIKFLPHTLNVTSAASPRVDISSTCKVGHEFRVSLPLLTCSPSALPSQMLYCRGRNSRRDLWITLHFKCFIGSFLSEVCQFLVINILEFSSGSLKDKRPRRFYKSSFLVFQCAQYHYMEIVFK